MTRQQQAIYRAAVEMVLLHLEHNRAKLEKLPEARAAMKSSNKAWFRLKRLVKRISKS